MSTTSSLTTALEYGLGGQAGERLVGIQLIDLKAVRSCEKFYGEGNDRSVEQEHPAVGLNPEDHIATILGRVNADRTAFYNISLVKHRDTNLEDIDLGSYPDLTSLFSTDNPTKTLDLKTFKLPKHD